MEDFNQLQQQQQEDNKNQDFDFNFLQQNTNQWQSDYWQLKNVKIALNKYGVYNIFNQEELQRFKGYNTIILKENVRVFSKKYQRNMIPLLRLIKRDRQDTKFVTVPFQKQDIGYYWYIEQGYRFERVIGYVFDSSTYEELRRNPNYLCLVSLFNDGGVLPLRVLTGFIRKNKNLDHLFSIICLPR
ncbi:hypothetical protein PPERSA_10433 [Pseudocohnilembus persalinus]|uniref:Uncharacterized protein n=1 Tax=Pseudocohnilembus persalinus TaxID=266149 RepID=A0A0V0QW74_PSEPJ|nr:hypothetical protein PPERSA_10433 [Pseudocohnilembus persalinus]|eukprot:KRX06575.1 hypothetical protein PPERSA_10433 [Pseudocohnilembus persalinus]